MLPPSYQTHLQYQLNRAEYLLLTMLVNLLHQTGKARNFSDCSRCPLHLTVGVKDSAILSLPQLTLEKSGFRFSKHG